MSILFNLKNTAYTLHIPQNHLFSLFSDQQERCIFIKNSSSVYQYANPFFHKIMGIRCITHLSDKDLYSDAEKIALYQAHDAEVLATEQILHVHEEIAPKKNTLITKRMQGSIYPLYGTSSKPIAILGVVQSSQEAFQLTIERAVCLTKEEMETLFVKRSYKIRAYGQTLSLSRRELQCVIELIQGKTAAEIAAIWGLKQTSIESYIENIKNKLGATSKSNLIMTIFNQKILQQMVL